MNPFRGWRYYFTTPSLLSGSKSNAVDEDENRDVDADVALKRKQFEEVAVTGEHMLGWARLQPWVSRVLSISISCEYLWGLSC